ncbi:MAG: hypothetical protein ABI596_10855 [Pyrinomonadaceae bacterium]
MLNRYSGVATRALTAGTQTIFIAAAISGTWVPEAGIDSIRETYYSSNPQAFFYGKGRFIESYFTTFTAVRERASAD